MNRLPRPLTLTLQGLLLLSLLPVSTCSPKPSALARIKATGKLTVAATNSPTTCYDGAQGLTGYECDKCHSQELLLKLKDGRAWDQVKQRVQAAAAS